MSKATVNVEKKRSREVLLVIKDFEQTSSLTKELFYVRSRSFADR